MEHALRHLYFRWIVANGIAELIGLGATFALVAGLFTLIDRASLPVALLLAAGAAAVGAAVEGTAVGGLQWRVLSHALPELPLRRYVLYTALGAFVAWLLGMLPSTLISAAAEAGSGPAAEPPLGAQLLLAAGMGLALGPFIGVPQWLVLRHYLPRAGWWVLANSCAWALGMPMVFVGTSTIAPASSPVAIAFTLGASLLVAGLVVGAVHGAFLVRLLARAARDHEAI